MSSARSLGVLRDDDIKVAEVPPPRLLPVLFVDVFMLETSVAPFETVDSVLSSSLLLLVLLVAEVVMVVLVSSSVVDRVESGFWSMGMGRCMTCVLDVDANG